MNETFPPVRNLQKLCRKVYDRERSEFFDDRANRRCPCVTTINVSYSFLGRTTICLPRRVTTSGRDATRLAKPAHFENLPASSARSYWISRTLLRTALSNTFRTSEIQREERRKRLQSSEWMPGDVFCMLLFRRSGKCQVL